MKTPTTNQSIAGAVAQDAIEKAQSTGRTVLKFSHPSGKWYQLSVNRTKSDTSRLLVHRTFGGKGNRRPGRKTAPQTAQETMQIILDRLNHGYTVDSMATA